MNSGSYFCTEDLYQHAWLAAAIDSMVDINGNSYAANAVIATIEAIGSIWLRKPYLEELQSLHWSLYSTPLEYPCIPLENMPLSQQAEWVHDIFASFRLVSELDIVREQVDNALTRLNDEVDQVFSLDELKEQIDKWFEDYV